MCFTFRIPDDMDHRDVDAAELWVYRQPDSNANEAQSFLISEIEEWGSKKINKPFAIHYANSSGNFSIVFFFSFFTLISINGDENWPLSFWREGTHCLHRSIGNGKIIDFEFRFYLMYDYVEYLHLLIAIIL